MDPWTYPPPPVGLSSQGQDEILLICTHQLVQFVHSIRRSGVHCRSASDSLARAVYITPWNNETGLFPRDFTASSLLPKWYDLCFGDQGGHHVLLPLFSNNHNKRKVVKKEKTLSMKSGLDRFANRSRRLSKHGQELSLHKYGNWWSYTNMCNRPLPLDRRPGLPRGLILPQEARGYQITILSDVRHL